MARALSNLCPTGKASHSYRAAQAEASKASRRYEQPMTAYRCDQCGAWHVCGQPHTQTPANAADSPISRIEVRMTPRQIPGRIEALRLAMRQGFDNSPADLLQLAGIGQDKQPRPATHAIPGIAFTRGASGLSLADEASLPF